MSVTFPKTRTGAEWRAMAADSRKSAFDSFERCDTDGFLSQWAAGEMASRYLRLAEIADNGGKAQFVGIATVEDPTTLVEAREIKTRYGWTWLIIREGGNVFFNQSWAKSPATRRKNDSAKGFLVVTFEADAVMFDDGRIAPMRDADRVVTGDTYDEDMA